MSTIPASEIKYKKKVGVDGGDPVHEIATVGGLHLIVAVRKGGAETLGIGSHRAVARHLATKKARALQWTELSKSEAVEDRFIQHLIPKWEAVTDAQRAKEKA